MSYTNTKLMFEKALSQRYCIGAFNVSNLEQIQAVIDGAVESNSPVILQASESACKYAGMDNLVSIVKNIAEKVTIPIALHLDHGSSVEVCKKAINCGFSSVMIDLSALSFNENIKGTKSVVKYAKKHNVSTESELGEIVGIEDEKFSNAEHFTDPIKAKEFVTKTGVDSLAVSIGTAHGINKGLVEPEIKFNLISKIEKEIPSTPLVCHGASTVDKLLTDKLIKYGGIIKNSQGIPKRSLSKMSETAICKINMDTDLRLCFTSSMREYLNKNPEVFDPRKVLGYAEVQTKEYIKYIISEILHSNGKA